MLSKGDAMSIRGRWTMTLIQASYRFLVVVATVVVFGAGAPVVADGLVSHAQPRRPAAKRCHLVKHRKGTHVTKRCLPKSHYQSATTPSTAMHSSPAPTPTSSTPPTTSREGPCPRCAGGCPTLQRPTGGPGPTGLVGGIEVAGGPASSPEACAHWEAGEVRVENASGEVVATQEVATGQTFNIAVGPGTYCITGVLGPSSSRKAGPFVVVAGQTTQAIVEYDLA